MALRFESEPRISFELSKHVSVQKLQENRRNFPELGQVISREDEKRLELIQRRLRALPLVHCSRNAKLGELESTSQQPDIKTGNTHQFDKSLGLDEYVFLHWGLGDWSQYGQHLYCYSSELLFQPTTIVSPFDVLNIAIGEDSLSYEEISTETKARVEREYFDQVLSGSDWFHLVTLRVLNQLKKGYKMIPISSKTFGEIKILQRVTSPVLAEYHGRHDIESRFYGEQMYPNGFIFKNIYDNLRLGHTSQVDPEPTPDQLRQLKAAWEEVS